MLSLPIAERGMRPDHFPDWICRKCGRLRHPSSQCWIVYFEVTKRKPPPGITVPCPSCSSKHHSPTVCPYLVQRCHNCGFLGHIARECLDRTPEQHLDAFLKVNHFGFYTGRAEHVLFSEWGFFGHDVRPAPGVFSLGIMATAAEVNAWVMEYNRRIRNGSRRYPDVPDPPPRHTWPAPAPPGQGRGRGPRRRR